MYRYSLILWHTQQDWDKEISDDDEELDHAMSGGEGGEKAVEKKGRNPLSRKKRRRA